MCAGKSDNYLDVRSVLVLLISYLFCIEAYSDYKLSLDDESTKTLSSATLSFVAIISRHGSRAPVFTYPHDPYPFTDRHFWPQGKGELTNYGKQQLYELGQRLRKRYNGFLPMTYYPNDTIAVYNPNNRDYDSLSCLLASLYTPVQQEVWNKNLNWQPIPSSPYKFDVCELIESFKCPQYLIDAMKSVAAYSFKELIVSSHLLSYVSNYTGEAFFLVPLLTKVFDALYMQEENGFKVPEWVKPVFRQLQEYSVRTWNALYAGSNRMLTFTAGPDLNQIVGLFNKKVAGNLAENTRLYIEMAHDCTLYALLKALGSSKGDEIIKTSAYLTFELHKLSSSYVVQVLYYKDFSDENPTLINIERCPSPCFLENFNKFVKSVTGTDSWETACYKISLF